MILLKPSFKIETPIDGENAVRMLKLIESAARTCYKSECKISEDSYKSFVRKIVHVHKHESVIEHSSVTVRFITDRGVTHK
jgi:thymidylate synthase (FAD)